MVNKTNCTVKQYNMKINASKTKTIVITKTKIWTQISIEGYTIKKDKPFVPLRSNNYRWCEM